MKFISFVFSALLVTAISALGAAPVIAPPVNQASYALPFEPGYGIAQGAMFAVFGTEMGPAELAGAASLPLSTELAGTSVQVTVNGQTRGCFLIFTSAGQLAAILPSDTPLGEGQITVTYNGMTSAPQPILVVEHAVGMFTVSQDGKGPAVITDENFVPVSYVQSLAPGDIGIAWVTGLGARSADDGPAAATDFKDLYDVQIAVGGIPADVLYAGPSGCCAALGQIVFEIPGGGSEGTAQATEAADPENKRIGCNVPVVVTVGETFSKWTSVSVSDDGPVCNDPHGLTSDEITRLSEGTPVAILSARAVGITTVEGEPRDPPTTALSAESTRNQVFGTEYFMQMALQIFESPADYGTSGPPALGSCFIVDGQRVGGPSTDPLGSPYDLRMEVEQNGQVEADLEATFGAGGTLNFATKSGGGSFDRNLNQAALFVNGGQTPTAVASRPNEPFFHPVTDSASLVADIDAANSGFFAPIVSRFNGTPSGQNHNIVFDWYLHTDGIAGRAQAVCANSGPDFGMQAWAARYVTDRLLTSHATVLYSEFQPNFVISSELDGVLAVQEELRTGSSIPPSETRPFQANVAGSSQQLQAEAGRAQSTGSCNVNVNNLGVAAGCSFNLPNAIGWGFWAIGSDRPFVAGPLQGQTQFSAALGLENWVPGQAASIAIPDLAEEGQVEIRIWSEAETISGALVPAP